MNSLQPDFPFQRQSSTGKFHTRHFKATTIYDKPIMNNDVLTKTIESWNNLQIIHNYFKMIYQGENQFAMGIEFKITETTDGDRGRLVINQARP